MPLDPAAAYRESQARQRVAALKTDIPLRRYVDGMARRGEILKNSESTIIEAVLRPPAQGQPRNHFEHLGEPPPERPADLPRGNSHSDLIGRCVAYLDGAGSCYKNPAHVPDPTEQPLTAIARRLGMDRETAERFYRNHAVALAGRTGAALAQGAFYALTTVQDGRFVGVEPPADNPPPEPTAQPATPPWRPGDNGGLMIAGRFYANPPGPDQVPASPQGPREHHIAAVRSGF